MRQIYRNAKKTLIWLGPDVSDRALVVIEKLARAFKEYESRNDEWIIFQMEDETLQLYDIPPL
jgi:hypothetical protein